LATDQAIAAPFREFYEALSQHPPSLPDSIAGVPSGRGSFFLVSPRSYLFRQAAAAETSRSLLEVELARVRENVVSRTLAPRSYVAIVDRPEEIAVGGARMTETESLHVIYGTW
jgi:hypothetical protein